MDKHLFLSVHDLVDFLLRTGDIDDRVFNNETMSEGTLIHSSYQKRQKSNYISEYYLRDTFKCEDFEITLEGRADGVIVNSYNDFTIDEIKSTIADLNEFHYQNEDWHLGQAKCYALMLAREKGLDKVGIRLTYIHQIDESKMVKEYSFTTTKLEKYVNKLFKDYIEFYRFIYEKKVRRNLSADKIRFPYKTFREGQKELAKYSYAIAKDGGVLFVEAPTGIGKTMSTLYPFTKSFKDENVDKIFYLTAKNPGKDVAFNSIEILKENGLDAYSILLTAKDKICFNPGKACNPVECAYAKDYYTHIRRAIYETLNSQTSLSRTSIIELASHYGICPFEFQLDLSNFSDYIICDYNYFFDPMVYLRRHFEGEAYNTLVLVDEAHNLVERGRGMYSAILSSISYKQAKKTLKGCEVKKMNSALRKMTKFFKEFEEFPDGETLFNEVPPKWQNIFSNYLLAGVDVMKHHHELVTDYFKDFYFEVNRFSKLLDYYGKNFALYLDKNGKDIKLNLFCLDPSDELKYSMSKVKGLVVFSATLSPTNYYVDMIGGEKTDPLLVLPSPFKKENLCLMIAPTISTKYKNRDATIEEVASFVNTAISTKVGNYFIYAPSYEYMYKLIPYLRKDFELIIQEKEMTDIEKEQFLSLFVDNPDHTVVGVAVVGGAFGEGIDLVSNRLIGTIIIGVGMPQISYQRDLIKDYFDSKNNDGFAYSYVDPGMNRVMQAVGRVIRTETDKGFALLIDNRYLTKEYRSLFKNEWSHYDVVTSKEDIIDLLNKFWKNN